MYTGMLLVENWQKPFTINWEELYCLFILFVCLVNCWKWLAASFQVALFPTIFTFQFCHFHRIEIRLLNTQTKAALNWRILYIFYGINWMQSHCDLKNNQINKQIKYRLNANNAPNGVEWSIIIIDVMSMV